jgi:hypothetical protein
LKAAPSTVESISPSGQIRIADVRSKPLIVFFRIQAIYLFLAVVCCAHDGFRH